MINEKALLASIRDWYSAKYPTDDLKEEISPEATFYGLVETLEYHELPYDTKQNSNACEDVYDYLGVIDSVIRERVFEELANILSVDYEDVYHKWVYPYDYRRNIVFDDIVAPYIFGDIKLTESTEVEEESNQHILFDTTHYEEEEDYDRAIDDAFSDFIVRLGNFERHSKYRVFSVEGTVNRWNGKKTIVPKFNKSLAKLIYMTVYRLNDYFFFVEDGDFKLTGYSHDGEMTLVFKGVANEGVWSVESCDELLDEGELKLDSLGRTIKDFFS